MFWVLKSTHNICFSLEITKLNFRYALLTKVLVFYNSLLMETPVIPKARFFLLVDLREFFSDLGSGDEKKSIKKL